MKTTIKRAGAVRGSRGKPFSWATRTVLPHPRSDNRLPIPGGSGDTACSIMPRKGSGR